MCVGDGEAFQQLRKGRIEGHPLREKNIPRKESDAEGRKKICERKKDKANVERARQECQRKKAREGNERR